MRKSTSKHKGDKTSNAYADFLDRKREKAKQHKPKSKQSRGGHRG